MKQLTLIVPVAVLFIAVVTGCTPAADNYLKSGVEKAEKGDYAGAIKDYNEAIKSPRQCKIQARQPQRCDQGF
jgi:hypothetical protein